MRPTIVALLASAGLALCATTARADLPDPRWITFDQVAIASPLGIPIGGTPPGFDVVVRDESMQPRAGAVITLDFSASGIRLYTTQASGTTLSCLNRSISRVTDAQGSTNFVPRFGGWNDANSVAILVDGVIVGYVRGRSPDYDADGRVGLADLAIMTSDLLNNAAAQRSDFDLNGSVGLGDLALFSQQLLGAGSTQVLCP
jgi:hypothetical protein